MVNTLFICLARSEHAKYHHTGRVHTEKFVANMTARYRDPEYIKSISGEHAPMYGKHHTKETKIKMSLSAKGKHKSEEHKENLKKSVTKYFEEHEVSEETRKKLSISIIASWTEERKERYKARYAKGDHPMKGKKMSDEAKLKMSKAWTEERKNRFRKIQNGRHILWETYNKNGGKHKFELPTV